MGLWIGVGLLLGLLCGVLFGERCAALELVGQAYVGLLQMTVLPYLILSLVAKTGRLDVRQARKLGITALVVLVVFWLIGIAVIVLVSTILPPVEGATFYSALAERPEAAQPDVLARYIPTNIFHSLSAEYVPAIVVFCLFFGSALIMVPSKEPLLDFLDLCAVAVGRINGFLVRLAPLGLFALTAAAAGTLRLEEMTRLQAYLIMFALACLLAVVGILPVLVSSVTDIGYRDLLRAAREPLLVVIATGKLFVVLPEISVRCERLLQHGGKSLSELDESTARVVVPLAYPFPHLGKVLTFVFISFAAWYVGRGLTLGQTSVMAVSGTMSSFASPLVTIPYLLDQYQLPQDLLALFILPGFLTTRLSDVVGVMHLIALTVIVTRTLEGRLHVRWGRLALATCAVFACLGIAGAAGRWYLASTTLAYDLDRRFLSLEIPNPHENVVVYRSREDVPTRTAREASSLERVKITRVLRVGYHPDKFPYSFFNQHEHLVGMDVELMHRLADRLQVRLEFIPFTAETVVEQLEEKEIDVAISGLIMLPERLMRAAFTQPYGTATFAVVVRDFRRGAFDDWDDSDVPPDTRLGTIHEDVAAAVRRLLPHIDIVPMGALRAFFTGTRSDLAGVVMPAEEGAAWTVLYPEHSVVVPKPVVRRPVAMAVRAQETEWVQLLDRWLDYERLDGSLDRVCTYWVEGGGTQKRPPRWCVVRDVLHWLP